MKQLGSIVPILLLLGVGITSGLAAGELTASQQVQPQVSAVGETATVTLTLAYSGSDPMQVMVVPILPPGIITDMPGAKAASLSSGSSVPISYPIRAVESGNYLITSQISYTEDKATRRLNMVSEFTATGGSGPTTPGPAVPGTMGSQIPATDSQIPAPLLPPSIQMPGDNMPNSNLPNNSQPQDSSPMMPGPENMPGQPGQYPDSQNLPDSSNSVSSSSGNGSSGSSMPS